MKSEKENEASGSPIKIYEDFRKARKNLGQENSFQAIQNFKRIIMNDQSQAYDKSSFNDQDIKFYKIK